MSYEEIGLSGYVVLDGDINSLRHFQKKSIIFTSLWLTPDFMH
jgi:hypothetical protein